MSGESGRVGSLLLTDCYQLRMAASYLRRGMGDAATFSLFVRRLPAQRGFLVAAGLEDCLTFLEGFRGNPGDAAGLREVAGLTAADARALAGLRFTGDVWAVPEGRVVFENEPIIEVTAPIAEAQVVETYLLNQVTFQTAIASKAARCRVAAQGRTLVDFAFRRTHGVEAAMAVARVSAIAGFASTSNVEAARRFGLRASGTMAHSYVEAFREESDAFRAYAEDFPDHPTFLVDTYDTEGGVRKAIAVARQRGLGDAFSVRLDSGDVALLAVRARELLDEAGCPGAQIFVSGGFDERDIDTLLRGGAPIDAFGVGTRMGVSSDAPSLDSAYKLVAYAGRPVLKLSAGKSTLPAAKQVFRDLSRGADVVGLRDERIAGRESLLGPVMAGGRRTSGPEPLQAMRERLSADLDSLPSSALRIDHPESVGVVVSDRLQQVRERCVADAAPGAGAAGPTR